VDFAVDTVGVGKEEGGILAKILGIIVSVGGIS
jgi:hypothetical protein